VLIGGYDHLGQGNFLTVKKDATLRTGGGAISELSTNVYDCLVPKGKTQKDVLSSFDEKGGGFAVVYPVEVDSKGKSGNAVRNDVEIARLTALLEKEESADRKRKQDELPGLVQKESLENTVALYFHAGEYQKAEQAADKVLLSSPDNPVALAYKGSLLAMKGGKTKSVAEAMRMVSEGYVLMDKAVRLASNDVEKITASIARGSVSSSVPESVFMKSVQGAEDFSEAAAVSARLGGMQMQTGELYIKACICLEKAGQNDKAELMCMRAKQYPMSTYTKVNLLKRGIE
jgi:tetratricopeptide (TPR) repeat protein